MVWIAGRTSDGENRVSRHSNHWNLDLCLPRLEHAETPLNPLQIEANLSLVKTAAGALARDRPVRRKTGQGQNFCRGWG